MKYYNIKSLLSLCICSILLISCDPKIANSAQGSDDEKSMDCTKTAMVKDKRGTDGCQFLLVLDDGTKILPAGLPEMDFKFNNNQMVKIGYQEEKDGMSACMMEDMIATITCIELVGQTGGIRPEKKDCVKLNGAYDVDWMRKLVGKYQPSKIDRYDYLDGYAYYLQTSTMKILYDCQGNKLCEVEGKAMNDCTRKVSGLGEAFTIWVKNE